MGEASTGKFVRLGFFCCGMGCARDCVVRILVGRLGEMC